MVQPDTITDRSYSEYTYTVNKTNSQSIPIQEKEIYPHTVNQNRHSVYQFIATIHMVNYNSRCVHPYTVTLNRHLVYLYTINLNRHLVYPYTFNLNRHLNYPQAFLNRHLVYLYTVTNNRHFVYPYTVNLNRHLVYSYTLTSTETFFIHTHLTSKDTLCIHTLSTSTDTLCIHTHSSSTDTLCIYTQSTTNTLSVSTHGHLKHTFGVSIVHTRFIGSIYSSPHHTLIVSNIHSISFIFMQEWNDACVHVLSLLVDFMQIHIGSVLID